MTNVIDRGLHFCIIKLQRIRSEILSQRSCVSEVFISLPHFK